jgi:hypothetical protein
MPYSDEYVHYLQRGPFPGRIDPWAEAPRYFKQVRSGVVGALHTSLHDDWLKRGYIPILDASIQMPELRQPNLYLRRQQDTQLGQDAWDYETATARLAVEPGIEVDPTEEDLPAIFVRHMESGELVTVIEVIAPQSKTNQQHMIAYEDRRSYLVHQLGVNVVEIDLTRSAQRLLQTTLVASYAYIIAIYLPGEAPRFIGMEYNAPLKSFALPLRREVLKVETQRLYESAYQSGNIAAKIDYDRRYERDDLPFPMLLTGAQREEAFLAVENWQEKLESLRQATPT